MKCKLKKKRTKEEAFKLMCEMNKYDEVMTIYKCHVCGHYHLASVKVKKEDKSHLTI
jgi:hypothetical protein